MDNKAMYQLTYGLFVLSAKDGDKDNGCIINTAGQVTTTPNRITIAVNKQNCTHDMIRKTGEFNLSILDESAPFAIFERFGFQCGRDTDKLAGLEVLRADNGLFYLKGHASAFLSGKVVETMDLGTHTLFLADVTDGALLSGDNPITYAYYQKNTKPKPEKTEKKGYRCKICGYIYEGEPLPEDFICPICKHGAIDFEKII
ncbi:MAG: flavin reductase [Lachnospiraceae bacterium]|nr:flavin reductase [Lachnospiraceae bacterium]